MAKNFQDLTIKDAFMFAAVMQNENQCRELLRRAPGMEITSVKV